MTTRDEHFSDGKMAQDEGKLVTSFVTVCVLEQFDVYAFIYHVVFGSFIS